jgi:hypothetical protein
MDYASTVRLRVMMLTIVERKKLPTPDEPQANLPVAVLAHEVKEAFLAVVTSPQQIDHLPPSYKHPLLIAFATLRQGLSRVKLKAQHLHHHLKAFPKLITREKNNLCPKSLIGVVRK